MRSRGPLVLALLLLCAPAWAVTIVEKTVGGAAPDYATLKLFEAANTNLVTADAIWKAVCRNFEDTDAVEFAGWTTSATQYVWITSDPATLTASNRYKWSTDRYRLVVTAALTALEIGDTYMLIDAIQVKTARTGANSAAGIRFAGVTSTKTSTIRKCIVHATADTAGQYALGIQNSGGAGSTHTINVENSLIMGTPGNANEWGIDVYTGTINVYASTVYGQDIGLSQRNSKTLNVTDVVCVDSTNCYEGTIGGTYNTSDVTDDWPNADHVTNTIGEPTFADKAGGDYRLAVGDAVAKNTGTTIAGFTDDIVGTTRPQGAAWDRGFHEYVPLATFPPLLLLGY